MNLLDMRTVIFSYVISNAICGAVMAFLWFQNRKQITGLGFWLVDFLMQFAAVLLITMRGIVPDFTSMVISNSLVVGGTILLLMGLERYTDKPGPQLHNYIFLVLFICVQTFFTLVQPNLLARNLNISLGLLVICAQCAWLMLHRVDKKIRQNSKIVGTVFVLYSLINFARIFIEFNLSATNDLFKSGLFDTLVVLTFQMLFISLTFALFLMVNRGLFTALEEDNYERKLAEDALKISEEKFSIAFQNHPDAITITSIEDGKIIEVNESFNRISEYSNAEAMGKTTIELNLWGNLNDRKRFVKELQKYGKVLNFETKFRRKSGDLFNSWISGGVIQIRKQNYVLTVIRDISDRKKIEEALRDSEAEQQALFASMQDIVIVYDKDGRYLNIANTGSKLFINPPKSLIGKTIHEVILKKEADKWVGHIRAVLAAQRTKDIEYSLEIDHHQVWFNASVSPMNKDSVVWVAHDITKRKKNELIQKTIYGITQAAIADKGIDTLYHSIHSFIGGLIPAENFYIALLDPATNLISFPYYVDQYDQAPTETTPIQGFTGYVIRTGKPLLADREVTDRLIQRGEVEMVGTMGEDWMGTPLKIGERIIGVMAVQSYSKVIHFNKEDLKFFDFVSTQVAQAIDRKQRENESFFIGTHDQLTGLYNRTFFEEEFSRLEKSRLFPVSIFIFDVDKLKTVNDTQGHLAGDEILRCTAQVLMKSFRSEDMVARIGGDEFVALLSATDENAAQLTLERIKHFLQLNNKNKPAILKISIGIATCEKQGSLAETLKQADERMYLDKRSKG